MESKEQVLKRFYAILAELESGTVDLESKLGISLVAKLGVLYDILGEAVDEEYWDTVEKYI